MQLAKGMSRKLAVAECELIDCIDSKQSHKHVDEDDATKYG
jgi:hypothetical protein